MYRLRFVSKSVGALCLATTLSACQPNQPTQQVTQVAAKVNDKEITVHEVNNALLSIASLKNDSLTQRSQNALNQIISQTLAQEKAYSLSLDQNSNTILQLESSRRQVLAQAWANYITQDLAPISLTEQRRFYDNHPQWFSKRQFFKVQNVVIRNPNLSTPEWQLINNKEFDFKSLMNLLKIKNINTHIGDLVISSENISPQEYNELSVLNKGQFLILKKHQYGDKFLQIWHFIDKVDKPLDWLEAQPAIELKLTKVQQQEHLLKELQALKNTAKIEFFGSFASSNYNTKKN